MIKFLARVMAILTFRSGKAVMIQMKVIQMKMIQMKMIQMKTKNLIYKHSILFYFLLFVSKKNKMLGDLHINYLK